MKHVVMQAVFLLIVSAAEPIGAAAQHNPRVLLETNFGDIVIELYPRQAPITVDNFLGYVNSGFYDGLLFHRVMEGFMIQGGGFYLENLTIYPRQPGSPIINESDNGLRNLRGTIAMARTTEPDSATSQFFINHVDNLFLDRENAEDEVGYCVFGRVVRGMDVVDNIALTDVYYVNLSFTHFPYNPTVDIISASVLPCELSACSDLTYDGRINLADLAVLACQWAGNPCDSANGFCGGSDFNYDGLLDTADLERFTDHWLGPVGTEPQICDLVEDGVVNLEDLTRFLTHWLDTGCCPGNEFCQSADFNRSGSVDFEDFRRLAGNWQAGYGPQ